MPTRSFVGLAEARELAARPELGRAWTGAFAPGDDATLTVYAAGAEPADAEHEARAALVAVGVPHGPGSGTGVLSGPRADALEIELAHSAHVRLGEALGDRALAALPAVASAEELRAAAERRWSFGGVDRPLRFALMICALHPREAESWGDLHFARAVAAELARRGHEALIQTRSEWRTGAGRDCDVVLHLRGVYPYAPSPSQLNLLWCISHPERVTAAECDRFDAAWSASPRHAAALSAAARRPVEPLAQATDPALFFPDPDPVHERELVFVANSRRVFRPVLRDLLPTVHDLAVWGDGWEGLVASEHLAGTFLPNEEVRRAYSSAAIVLNDHWDDMRGWGVVSNRVYDVLACGGALVSDHLPELGRELGDAVCSYRTREDLVALVERLLADPAERARRGTRGRELVLARHTFSQRVDTLLEAVSRLRGAGAPSAARGAGTRVRGTLQDLRRSLGAIRS